MAFNRLEVNDLATAALDDSDQVIVGESNTYKKATVSALKNNILGTSPSYTTDTEPYLMRQTAHTGVVGKCALNKLVGGSLGWNQLVNFSAGTQTSNGITATLKADGTVVLNGTATANFGLNLGTAVSGKNGHVEYIGGCPSGGSASTYYFRDGYRAGANDVGNGVITKNTDASGRIIGQINVINGTTVSNLTFVPQIIDLTTMFGSTIADYVYGLEQANAGAGVAWLSQYIDLSTYHAYDAGSIQSVQATAHVTKDANDNVIGNYPLGSDTLRGIPQLVSNKLAFDGDIKTPDGTIRRRYGTVDLGTLTYSYNATYGMNAVLPSDAATPIISGRAGVCGRYTLFQGISTNFVALDKVFTFCNNNMSSQKRIFIKDSAYTDAATFKTTMSGVYFVYPLETETTESSTAFQKIQTIDADGTESFTTSNPVPVGHETQTPDNVLAALSWVGE